MNFKLNMKVSTVGTYQDWDRDVCDVLTGHKESTSSIFGTNMLRSLDQTIKTRPICWDLGQSVRLFETFKTSRHVWSRSRSVFLEKIQINSWERIDVFKTSVLLLSLYLDLNRYLIFWSRPTSRLEAFT